MLRFVAATMRTSACSVFVPPTRWNSRSWRKQERRLSLQREFADLIEEERASVRRFDFSLLLGDGAAEGAALVSEQFAFHQGVHDGGTIDRGKWSVLPAAVAVDVARDQLLSGSAFAENEHRRLGARHLADEIADLAGRRTVPHDSLIDIGIVPRPNRSKPAPDS